MCDIKFHLRYFGCFIYKSSMLCVKMGGIFNVIPVLVYESSFSSLTDRRRNAFIIDGLMHP